MIDSLYVWLSCHFFIFGLNVCIGCLIFNMYALHAICMWSAAIIGAYWCHRNGHISKYKLAWLHEFASVCKFIPIWEFIPICKFADRWFGVHTIGHHKESYPSNRFLASEYQVNQQPNSNSIQNCMYIIHILGASLIIYWIMWIKWSIHSWLYFLISISVFLYIENHFHNHIHLKGSRYEQYEWFRQMRRCHHLHHTYPYQSNFAVAALWVDLVFGTLMVD